MTFEHIKEILKNKTVGIAGCGGLGSNCAVALARVGIGKLILIDFDVVEESNLNRQYYFIDQIGMPKVKALHDTIKRINPSVEIETHLLTLDSKSIQMYFKNVDVMVEAFDSAEMKQVIVETFAQQFPQKPLVIGNGMAGFGATNELTVNSYPLLFICGDNCSEIGLDNPPLAPRVGIVANMQANVVLEILLNKE